MSKIHSATALGTTTLLALLSGCAAGYPPATSAANRENDEIALRASRIQSAKATEGGKISSAAGGLEAELFLTDAGKVIAKAIHAHGGWDAWLALSRVSYVRDRITIDEQGQPVTGQVPQNTRFEVDVDATGRLVPSASPDLEDERFTFALPFVLADASVGKEYIGVEVDAKTGETLEKLRFTRVASGSEWFIASFDHSTYVLKRVLHQRDGKFTFTIFSAWKDVDGIRLATKRSVYALEGLFDHPDTGRPDRIDVIAEAKKSP